MDETKLRDTQVRAKTAQVVDYHRDEARPGKPLYLLIPGGIMALISLGLMAYVAYSAWLEETLAEDTALILLAVLAPLYIGGVFVFSYGYELYDLARALRLTAIIVIATVAVVIILAVLLVLLGGLGALGSSSGSKSKSSSASKSKGSSKASGSSKSGPSSTSRRARRPDRSGSPVLGSGSAARTVTREVVREREVMVEKGGKTEKQQPAPPQPITCPFCGRSYVPAQTNYACPACGAPTPAKFLPKGARPRHK